jgi:LmbE family N-acetylglucosaminyl deacetylase
VDFERVLVLFAHPDDAEFGTAGTVATWTREGRQVSYLCVTDGSAGSNDPGAVREEIAAIRREEQLAACEVLGVEDCRFLDVPDGHVEVTMELRRALTREVRRFRPDLMVAPDPLRLWDAGRTYINHIDHRNVGLAAMAVLNPDANTRPQFPELLEEGLEPVEVRYLWIPAYDGDADTFLDISETIEVKVDALRCHKSQIHDWPVDEWVRERAKELGAGQGMAFAESFKTFTLRVDEEKSRRPDRTPEAEGAPTEESV